jgi:hypothetical protein
MAKTTEQELKDMQAEIARLQAALGAAEIYRSEAEANAIAVTQANAFAGNTEEQATGRTVEMSVCLNPNERDEKKHKFKSVKIPTYYYTVTLPAGAGTDLTTNGVAYYHGQTYEFDQFTLPDIKSRVARTWDHEKSIHGGNENAYRKPTRSHLMTSAAIAQGAH